MSKRVQTREHEPLSKQLLLFANGNLDEVVKKVGGTMERIEALSGDKGARPYLLDYPLLIEAARGLRKSGDTASLYAIAGMAYAWMPTILKNWPAADALENLAKRAGEQGSAADAAKSLASESKWNPEINRSWVGTSKFLHFFAPDVFPIWDSVVASHWGLSRHQYERKEVYAAYVGLVFKWSTFARIEDLHKLLYPNLGKVSRIRVIEHALFLSSPGHDRKLEEKEKKSAARPERR